MERSVLVGCLIVLFAALFLMVLPKACATQAANEQAAIELHKDSIRNTYISPADQVVIDLSSDDFKKANEHANVVLNRAYSDKQAAEAKTQSK